MAALSAPAARRMQQSRIAWRPGVLPAIPPGNWIGSALRSPILRPRQGPAASSAVARASYSAANSFKASFACRSVIERAIAGTASPSLAAHPNFPSPPPRRELPLAGSHSQPGMPPSILVKRVNSQKAPTVTSRRGVDAIRPIEKGISEMNMPSRLEPRDIPASLQGVAGQSCSSPLRR